MGTVVTGGKGSADNNGAAGISSGKLSHVEGAGGIASGEAAHSEGSGTSASGLFSHAEGGTSIASGPYSHAEGNNTTASGQAAHSEGGSSRATGSYSHASGVWSTAPRYAQYARGSGFFAAEGDAQASRFTASRTTTDATPVVLTFDGNPSNPTTNGNVLTLLASRSQHFRIAVVARRSDVAGDAAGWEFSGVVSRGAAGNAALVGTVDGRAWGSAGAAAWDAAITVDTTDNYLKITATGEAAKTIRWVAGIDTVEVG